MAYKYFNPKKRHYIALQRKLGVFRNKIAQLSGRFQSSVFRKVNQNTGEEDYRYKQV